MTEVNYDHTLYPTVSKGQALNSTFWRLSKALGLIEDGQDGLDIVFEDILAEVEERLHKVLPEYEDEG